MGSGKQHFNFIVPVNRGCVCAWITIVRTVNCSIGLKNTQGIMNCQEKPSVYIDMDDVLCDTATAYTVLVKQYFGKQFQLEQIHSFNLQKSFALNDEENRHMFELAHRREFTLALQPFEGVSTALSIWKEKGLHLAIVTGRHTCARNDSLDWLHHHAIPYDAFIMVDKYNRSGTDHSVAISMTTLSLMSFAFAIEDHSDMANYLGTVMKVPVKLFDRPWNRHVQDTETISRFTDWHSLARGFTSPDSSGV